MGLTMELLDSPADITRQLLINQGAGTAWDELVKAAWPIVTDLEPPYPDSVVTIQDTAGIDAGSSQFDGTLFTFHGLQARIRGTGKIVGWRKADAIRDVLARAARVEVNVGGNRYLVWAYSGISNVIPLGKETPTSSRMLFTVNATVSIEARS